MGTEEEVEAVGRTLVDAAQPLPARFRALFTLRNLGGRAAVDWISRAFGDGSALLKHELAYCLGQMQDEAAIPVLIRVLEDASQEPMVRHEAGEALGAIGNPDVLDILKRYSGDPVVEVAETCQLAVKRLEWLQENRQEPGASPYLSVDPAPPAEETDVAKLRDTLLDESQTLFDRYRAMFALRNLGGQAAVLALADDWAFGPKPEEEKVVMAKGTVPEVEWLDEDMVLAEDKPEGEGSSALPGMDIPLGLLTPAPRSSISFADTHKKRFF